LKIKSGTALVFLFAAVCLQGCGKPGAAGYFYLESKKSERLPEAGQALTLHIVRRFEKENWCRDERDSFIKDGFEAECTFESEPYAKMYEGEAVGLWYAIQSIGPFPPTIIYYEYSPPVPNEVMLEELKQSVPHILQFAALHSTPAQVRIISPDGTEH